MFPELNCPFFIFVIRGYLPNSALHVSFVAGARVIYFYRVLHAGSQLGVFPIW